MSALIATGYGLSIGLIITSGLGALPSSPTAVAPTITNVSQSSGTTSGGDTVTITGADLYLATSVTFGGIAAAIISNSATEIVVATPPHAAGIVAVAATTSVGTATATNAFLFIHPAVTPLTALYSGQTAAGTHRLFLGLTSVPLVQDSGYLDATSPFPATMITNLFDIVPGENPSQYGVCDHIEVETNGVAAPIIGYLTDEDPNNASYQTAFTSTDPPHRAQGTNLVETWYPIMGDPANVAARRISIGIQWDATEENQKLYGFAIAYEPKG